VLLLQQSVAVEMYMRMGCCSITYYSNIALGIMGEVRIISMVIMRANVRALIISPELACSRFL